MHVFRLADVGDVDVELKRWLREAYAVGEQKHLNLRRRAPKATNAVQQPKAEK